MTAALVLMAAASTPPVVAQEDQALGEVRFENSGPAAVQEPFLRGLLLLHNFEYEDARTAFREARRVDPGFDMAYWGEALTYDHPLWGDEDLDAARRVLAELESTGVRGPTPTARERAYLAAVGELYGSGDKALRDQRYASAMADLAQSYPSDDDAAALYALALLGSAEGGRDYAIYMRAGAVLEELVDRSPRHPGALHYMIHAYDDPIHAPLGLRAAREYGAVAADAVHALHMPSHIFFALGMWEDAIRMNERSWRASVERAERLGQGPESWSYHALWWLHYAYLQEGRIDDARRLLATARQALDESGAGTVEYHLGQMRAAHIVADLADDDLAREAFEADVDNDRARAAVLAAVGQSRIASGQLADARAIHRELAALASQESQSPARPLALQLQALLALRTGEPERGLSILREAAEIEFAMPYEFGPPLVVKPGYELLGEELLAAGDAEGAVVAFEKAMERAPGRRRTLEGLRHAETFLAGRTVEAALPGGNR